jgi:hypothetical protein
VTFSGDIAVLISATAAIAVVLTTLWRVSSWLNDMRYKIDGMSKEFHLAFIRNDNAHETLIINGKETRNTVIEHGERLAVLESRLRDLGTRREAEQ